MRAALSLVVVCVSVAGWLAPGVIATPFGAPVAACVTMTPQHNAAPQPSDPLYALTVARIDANTFSVMVQSTIGLPFKGFLIQARPQGSTVPVGTFTPEIEDGTQWQNCTNVGDSVTHTNNLDKASRIFYWNAPTGSLSGIRFVATVCYDRLTFWLGIESVDLGSFQ